MNVERTFENNRREKLELGDVIEHEEHGFYLIVKEFFNDVDKYVAKSFNGHTGLFGRYNSLDALTHEFYERGTSRKSTIYKSSEYKLELNRK
jgi:hypothetical protein